MNKGKGEEVGIHNTADLIDEYDALLSYPNTKAPEALVYESWMLAELRDEIHKAGLDENEEVKKLDKRLLRQLLILGFADLKESNNPDWWWHLDEIAKKQYPPEKLPEHLREIYLKYF